MNGLHVAIETLGSRAELARRLNISSEAVRKWERTRIPAERCLEVEQATGGAVTRQMLRPDLWPADQAA
jgi:DNA-binding transcriptional regulator YdaS (Cro superfamily)